MKQTTRSYECFKEKNVYVEKKEKNNQASFISKDNLIKDYSMGRPDYKTNTNII